MVLFLVLLATSQVPASGQSADNLKIVVGTCQKYLNDRIIEGVAKTWATEYPVQYAVGADKLAEIQTRMPPESVFAVDAPDNVYPPAKKELLIWKSIAQQAAVNGSHQWFLRADDDSYVTVWKLQRMMQQLPTDRPFVGGIKMVHTADNGAGRESPIVSHMAPDGMPAVRDVFFCQGMAVLMNKKALDLLTPKLDECVKGVEMGAHPGITHSDVALGWCLQEFAGVNPCETIRVGANGAAGKEKAFAYWMYFKHGPDGLFDDAFKKEPYYSDMALLFHPLKKPSEFANVHKYMELSKQRTQQGTMGSANLLVQLDDEAVLQSDYLKEAGKAGVITPI